ncbi:U7 snRNA-associated Sm-like protein LSm11 [Battus philenor]|uniref:U7 snRNA-associated Sm-like protein LSm11 n=1 Tax=Battus philenor TaxID=42288 RepID=UPI0035D070D4
MSDDSSTSESEVSACSSKFDPLKTLYSSKSTAPVENAPMYESVNQYESALESKNTIFAVGNSALVLKLKAEKEKKKMEEAKELEEKNKQRFARYGGLVPRRPLPTRMTKNVLTRIEKMEGPLATLKDCVDQRLRVKVITRSAASIRGVLHATLIAFDKQWNLALSDVLEVWKRKSVKKRKIPPCMGVPVPKGTAAKLCGVPVVTETPLGKGVWECTRHIPQLMVRGEHVVLVNIVER